MDEIRKLQEESTYAKTHVNADAHITAHDKHHPGTLAFSDLTLELKHHLGQLHLNHETTPQLHPVEKSQESGACVPLHTHETV
jgi:hypothetical protein